MLCCNIFYIRLLGYSYLASSNVNIVSCEIGERTRYLNALLEVTYDKKKAAKWIIVLENSTGKIICIHIKNKFILDQFIKYFSNFIIKDKDKPTAKIKPFLGFTFNIILSQESTHELLVNLFSWR